MNRKKAQLLLLTIVIPIVLSTAYSVYSIWNGYRLSLELIFGVSARRSLPGELDRQKTEQEETLTPNRKSGKARAI
jgi:hypothetical protein